MSWTITSMGFRWSLTLALSLFTSMLLACGLGAGQQQAQLAWVSLRDGNREIYLWEPSGTAINLTRHTGQDDQPAWSSDGRLAWQSDRDGNREIYVWDGERARNVSQNAAVDYSPVWSQN